ncbi:lantibiotic dehydratase family protein [Micromonospora sp. NBC_01655]|uniref:lantibiotic dehydratase n=1 Tax=Micromonospora sp. NBC_01655 TaxID=2975983 RepID=UPI0022584B82|nr:lantibiotic dehydratase [Micromonospora sp. NBC_01655]MCX4471775.1 lantibiotic dehydratase family protein [Micromonospora sp. NBC_01655]
MTITSQRRGAPSRPAPSGQVADEVQIAPYVLVRLAAVEQPATGPADRRLRRLQDRLVDRLVECRALAPGLTDELYRIGGQSPAAYRRSVLLPLRRDVHNGRSPGADVLARLDDLPDRLPALGRWLAGRAEIDRLTDAVHAGSDPALAAQRAALAALCGTEPIGRAVALTSPELLAAVRRTAEHGGAPDARSRKSEPTVLRYALRATTRTSPLSWFTIVGWGRWPADPPASPTDDLTPAAGAAGPAGSEPVPGLDLSAAGAPVAVTRPPAGLIASLFLAGNAHPERAWRTPHRLAPGTRLHDGHVVFYREHPATGVDGTPVIREERVRIPLRPALAAIVRVLRAAPDGYPPQRLVAALTRRSDQPTADGPPAPEPDRAPAADQLARRLIAQLCAERLLIPAPPTTEHDPGALAAVADWLGDTGTPAVADRVRQLDRDIRSLADVAAAPRGPLLRRISAGWQEALHGLDAAAPPQAPATEDVVLPGPVRLTRQPADRADLTALTGLALLFDADQVLRRLLRHRFVERYGPGGRCADLGEFFADVGAGLGGLPTVAADGALAGAPVALVPELAGLARLRQEVTRAVRAGDDGTETVVPAGLAADAFAALPGWLRARPVSYAFFGQPAPDGALHLNHIYGGWGRFTSRFLDLFADAGMRTAVAAQLRRMLPGRVAQFRPVHGFNANLHPLLVGAEISDDPRLGGLDVAAVELVHDPAGDQVRLLDPATGELLDVLYLGFLAPPALPARVAALLGDLGTGEVDLGHLAATRTVSGPGGEATIRNRLRCGRIVVARRSWRFDAGAEERFRAGHPSGAGPAPGDPVVAAAELRAAWGLPDQVFLNQGARRPGGREPQPGQPPQDAPGPETRTVADLRQAMTRPKPQFADLASPLHLRCLPRWLGRITGPLVVEEALPRPAGHDRPHRVAELVVETYLPAVSGAGPGPVDPRPGRGDPAGSPTAPTNRVESHHG